MIFLNIWRRTKAASGQYICVSFDDAPVLSPDEGQNINTKLSRVMFKPGGIPKFKEIFFGQFDTRLSKLNAQYSSCAKQLFKKANQLSKYTDL